MSEEQQNEQEQITESKAPQLDPETMKMIREQVKQDILQEQQSEHKKRQKEREEERKAHEQYIEKMKNSDEPWVEVVGMSEHEQGVKVELEWNDAFVEYLRQNGVSGTDDEQIVHRWVTLLLRDMADQMDGNQESSYE